MSSVLSFDQDHRSEYSSRAAMSDNKTVTGFVALDAFTVAIVGMMIIIFHFAVNPFHRGFFCDDDSIKYPYHDSTITSLLLYFFGSLLNVVTMTIVEGFIYKKRKLHPEVRVTSLFFSKQVHPLLWQLYKVVGVFAFTCCTSQMLTDVGKYSIGRLRPHFLDVCRPDMKSVNCSSYVTDFKCTGSDAYRIREGRLSFPSGHASFSAVTMVYFILYLQARFTWKRKHLLRPALQVLAYTIAFYTALSRVSDYKHHPTDVIAGHILGSSVAVYMVFSLSGLFEMRNYVDQEFEETDRNKNRHIENDIPI